MKKAVLIVMIFLPVSIFAQATLEIKGMVKDQLTQEPLFECHVYLNENYGVVTKEDGSFRIIVPEGYENETLKISYVGYLTFEKQAQEMFNQFQTIELIEDIKMLDDVVVITPDPWDNFRDAVAELYNLYDNKEELYTAILAELDALASSDIEVEVKESKSGISGGWSFIILFSILFFGFTIMIRPLNKVKSVRH